VSGRLSGGAALVLLALLAGCQAPVPPGGPTERVVTISDYERFVDDALTLLRLNNFTPDYVDRARGVILSEPETSGQWFEPWRRDAQGAYQLTEASLHTIRRMVTIHVMPLDDEAGAAASYRLTVRVNKSRYSAPERQITTASGALNMYSIRTPTVYGERGKASQRVHWVPLGRDALLESYFVEQLAAKTGAQLPPNGT
jgi:hypothetical protein